MDTTCNLSGGVETKEGNKPAPPLLQELLEQGDPWCLKLTCFLACVASPVSKAQLAHAGVGECITPCTLAVGI